VCLYVSESAIECPDDRPESCNPPYWTFVRSIFRVDILCCCPEIFPLAPLVVKCLIVCVFLFSFYVVGMWVSVRNELNKKIPTPSHELRRRNKEFYNWLDSQGRR